MEYTNNYHLPQWVESDRILMGDFNQMCADIDESLKSEVESWAAAVQSETEARTAADTALSDRITQAQTTADNALTTLPYAVGHYESTGEEVHITVGFRPSAVLFHGNYQNGGTGGNNYSLYTDGSAYIGKVSFTDDGFTVKVDESITRNPDINYPGKTYAYLALK